MNMSLDLHALMVFHNQRLSRELASRSMPVVVTETALLLLVALSAFFGNILVCLAIARNTRLRTPTNVLIFALSLTDITMSISTMPLTIGVLASGRWIYTKGVCIFQGSFPLTLAVISLQLMVVIAVNRYLCVLKPNLYRRVFTLKKSIGFAVGVFVLACLPTLSPLIYARKGYQFHPGKSYCAFAMEQNFIFALCMGLAFIASPFIIMTCLYCRIYCSVKNAVFPQQDSDCQPGNPQVHIQEVKVTKTLAAVLFGFSCCWFPIMIIDQIDMNNRVPMLPRRVYYMYGLLIYTSSAINPILYGLMRRAFRAEYKRTVTCKTGGRSDAEGSPSQVERSVRSVPR